MCSGGGQVFLPELILRISYRKNALHAKTLTDCIALILLCVVVLISAFYKDCHDYSVYKNAYYQNVEMAFEPAYKLFSGVSYKLGIPFEAYYAFLISFVLICVFVFFKKYGNNVLLLFLSFVLYGYLNYIQQLRSACAIAFVLIGTTYLIQNKKKLYFVLFLCISCLFQKTSLVFLLFFIAVNLRYSTIRLCVLLILICYLPLLFLGKELLYVIFDFIPILNRYLPYIEIDVLISKSAFAGYIITILVFLFYDYLCRAGYFRLTDNCKNVCKLAYVVICMMLLRGLGNNGYRLALMAHPILYLAFDMITYNQAKNGLRYILLLGYPLCSCIFWFGPWFPVEYNMLLHEMWRMSL